MVEKFGFAGVMVAIALFVGAAIGWVMNIVSLVHMLDGSITAMFVARVAGIFMLPLGAILGWL